MLVVGVYIFKKIVLISSINLNFPRLNKNVRLSILYPSILKLKIRKKLNSIYLISLATQRQSTSNTKTSTASANHRSPKREPRSFLVDGVLVR